MAAELSDVGARRQGVEASAAVTRDEKQASRREIVLSTLKAASEPLSIADIASRLRMHPNTVRFHLQALVERGQVEQRIAHRRTPGRPAQLFQIAPGMDPTGPRHYRLLAQVLADSLGSAPNPRKRAIEAGRAWGRRQAGASAGVTDKEPLARLVALLDDVGFAPELRAGDTHIGLRHCPFLELAESQSDIVCSIHLGLMQAALDTWDSPITVDRLDAFVQPDLCLAHLT